MCEEKTNKVYPESKLLLEVVAAYFAPEGPIAAQSYEDLYGYAELVYKRYMTNAAYDAAESDAFWDPEVYGPHAPLLEPTGAEYSTMTGPVDPPPPSSKWTGDQALRNNISFLRTTFWYLEMCAAVAEGDIGRVFEVIKVCH